MRKFLQIIIALLCLAFLFTGCGKNAEDSQKQEKTATLKDYQGNIIQLKHFSRIVSLAVSSDEILLELVPIERIAGVTASTLRPELSNAVAKAKQVKHRVDINSPESIYKVNPDLVIVPDFVRKEVISTLREMGITVFVYKKPLSFAEVRQNIKDIAKVVGSKPETLLQYMDEKEKNLSSRLKAVSTPKRMVYLMSTGIYCNPQSPFQDMCKYGGLKDATLELGIDKKTHLSKEEMIKLNPDVIMVPDFNWDGKSDTNAKVKAVLEDKAYENVKAIKNKQVFAVPGNHLYALSHHIVDASEDMARLAYPEYFK